MCGPARLNGRHCLTLPSCGFFHSSEDGVQATSETARLWAAERDVDRTSLFPATFVFAEMRALLKFFTFGREGTAVGHTPAPYVTTTILRPERPASATVTLDAVDSRGPTANTRTGNPDNLPPIAPNLRSEGAHARKLSLCNKTNVSLV